ncbi:MAG: GNAT family N-acetyltransferase [Hyphomonadaceae bacterium]|jgi:GNAT superfamily N-acetyltransferase|uniref:GNAT family N-acetyltransferase n=1 Tax=Aquidulcibacter sp. TaxID=2052990 RepID=UPI0022BCFE0A|nr:GNAT family N-acetyltransferase [Aquidulcibacter sp.]MCE2890274.1 GNAT family N-acetyltransferase [Hyphomonadaceae bacterium]MCZ8207864.1 GNAT family N-acetyltransferase [Aquidulcibacter sp.]
MSDLTLRLATPTDRDAIVTLMQRAYRGEESRQGWTSEADLIDGERITPEAIDQVLQNPRHRLLIAKNGAGQLIGCADIEQLSEATDTCSFGKFAVEPSLQGGGVGKVLLEAAEGEARRSFCATRMVMTVIEGRDELIAFYQRRGYVATGNSVAMADIHSDPNMTRGHDLILLEFAKNLD